MFGSVQLLSPVWLFVTPWTAAHQASLSFTISRSLLNSCLLSWWCHPSISSSVVPFSSCVQSFPASGSFLMKQLFTSDGQSIGASASASVLPMNIQDWFPLGWTVWISLLSKGLSRVFSNTTVQKHQFFGAQPSLWSNSHIHTWILEKSNVLVSQSCSTLCHPMDCTRQASLSFAISGACSNSRPLSRWCHPTISSSVVPFSSCL